MTVKRKVREDFDLTKEYSVNVLQCTREEKEEVQQGFFDVGLPWELADETYQHLEAAQYTNTWTNGEIAANCMFHTTTEGCNMTAKVFLELVYEPDNQGHVHAKLMLQYAEDAMTHTEPWLLWQIKVDGKFWRDCEYGPWWDCTTEYRRKPKTKLIHGVEVPVFEFTPKVGEEYYISNVGLPEFFQSGRRTSESCTFTQRMIDRGLIYPHTEEGKEAVILHTKAMLGIV